jgi:glycosyltransferase involved in cell wall biosynthesis/cytochrome c-type biogenesis protein CcmH/NrfG
MQGCEIQLKTNATVRSQAGNGKALSGATPKSLTAVADVSTSGSSDQLDLPGAKSPLTLPVRWRGPIFNPSGYASEAINYILPLSERVETGILHLNDTYSEKFVAGLPEKDRQRLFTLQDKYPLISEGVTIDHNPASGFAYVPDADYRIGRTMFETDRIPPSWVAACNAMDEVWVPSRFNVETFAARGVERDKLLVMPGSVDEEQFDPAKCQPLPLPNRARFNFLSTFEWSARKGWDVLLASYLREFSAADDVCLYLRTYLFSKPDGDPSEALWKLIRQYADTLNLGDKAWPRIELIAEQVPQAELPRLYMAVDCLAAPSRGEGWGRPHHEAMVMGLPVIATNWSGNTEFMNEANSYLIGYDIVDTALLEPELIQYEGHCWANPSETELRAAMRHVQQNPNEARERGARAREEMLRKYSRRRVTDLIVARLHEIERKLKSPTCPPAAARVPELLPDRADAKPRNTVPVNWEGPFLDMGSLSHVNRELTAALGSMDAVALHRVGNNKLSKEHDRSASLRKLTGSVSRKPLPNAEITVRHAWPPNWTRPQAGGWVMIQPWEFGVLPEEWFHKLGSVDQVWANSEYVRRVYVESGVPNSKIRIVPHGVDPQKFTPEAQPWNLGTTKKFKFLFVGGTIRRKGPDVLLGAFLRAFTSADDVCLVIKDFGGQKNYKGRTATCAIEQARQQPDAPEILYLDQEVEPEQMPGLYTACDCLVHPYRGEGFGLPVLEAMACALPVIVTGGGATDDFATDEFAYRLPALRRQLGPDLDGIKLLRRGWWLEPDDTALVTQLRQVFTHRDEARAKGRAASAHVRQYWTWQRAAQIARSHLLGLAARKKSEEADLAKRRARQQASIKAVSNIGLLTDAQQLAKQRKLQEAWTATVAAIHARPFHPEGWLLLAEIALAAGDGANAQNCARRAHELAPEWKPAKAFLKNNRHGSNPPDWLVVPQFGATPRLTVCVIAKNEERFIKQCLTSVKSIADQLLLLDTGSMDNTVEIARSLGAEVQNFSWCDDFAAARNAALAHARGDWVLMLDADEELAPGQAERLREDMKNPKFFGYRVPLIEHGQEAEGQSYVPRLFRNVPGVFYEGRIHEQVFPSLTAVCKNFCMRSGLGTAQITHHGYAKELVRQRNKTQRNLLLLRQAVEEHPKDPNLIMNLGLEMVRSGDAGAGLAKYSEAYRLMSAMRPSEIVPELREVLLTQFASCLCRARRYEDVVKVLTSPLASRGGLTASMHYLLGLAYYQVDSFRDVATQMRRCLAMLRQPTLSPVDTAIFTAAPLHCLAMSLARIGDVAEAEKAFQAALRIPERRDQVALDYVRFLMGQKRLIEALQRLHELVGESATNVAAWSLGAEIALSQPEFLEFARDWTGEAIRVAPNDCRLLARRGEALMLSQDLLGARELWHRVLKVGRQPRNLAALILCEAVEGKITTGPTNENEAAATSGAFIEWYRSCLRFGAGELIFRVNSQIGELRRVLPEAAKIIEATLEEARRSEPREVCAT